MGAARDNRVFHYAVLASIVLHGLALLAAPRVSLISKRVETWPAPIAARLVQPPPAAEPVAAEPEPVKPQPPKPVARSRPAPKPAPVAKTELPAPPPSPAPAPQPTPAPAAPATPAPEPSPSAAVAPQAAAPAPRPGAQVDADSVARFRLQVIEAATRYKRYPRVAQDNNWVGRTGVRVSFGADGRRASVVIVRSSGHEVLDRQALETVNRAEVPVPAGLRGKEFAFEFDVIFDLNDRS